MLIDVPLAGFVAEYYHHRPYARAGTVGHLLPLGGWDTLLKLVNQSNIDLMICRRNELWAGALPKDESAVRDVLAQGYTLLVRHAELHDEQLAELASSFAKDFAAAVNIHVYCTPAGEFGFGWHYDAEEVFLIQTLGRKEYCLRKNTVHPWPLEETLPVDMGYEREIMPLMRCELAPSDWLYIPAGYWHMGKSQELAITLAVGVQPHSAIEVIDFLRPYLIESLFWRQRMPVVGGGAALSTVELESVYHQLFLECAQELSKLLGNPDTGRAFIKQVLASIPTGKAET